MIHYSITKIITRSQINCRIFENNRCNIEEKITPNRNSCYCNIQTHSATLEITDRKVQTHKLQQQKKTLTVATCLHGERKSEL